MRPQLVYNCKSDSESPIGDDNIALTATYFPECSTAYGAVYGCNDAFAGDIMGWLESFARTATAGHPLMFPLLFAEIERRRLLEKVDTEWSLLDQKILNMDRMLQGLSKETSDESKTARGSIANTERDSEATKQWISVSSLRNGVESLKAQLTEMENHAKTLSETIFKPPNGGTDRFQSERAFGETIQARLRQMINELASKSRSCDTVLGGMRLTNQMVHISLANHTKSTAPNNHDAGMELLREARFTGDSKSCGSVPAG